MKITTKWQQDKQFIATTEQGHSIQMDGDNSSPSPMQLVLASIGGCSCIDVVMILQKGRHDISDCRCDVTAERADAVPAVFTKINAHYILNGKDLKLAAVERACQLSIEKYCSVIMMLKEAVEITYSFELSEN